MSTSVQTSVESIERPFDWRDSLWSANVWLLFLCFPLLSVFATNKSTVVKWVVVGLILVFAIVHVYAYRANGARAHSGRDDLDKLPFLDPLNAVPYYAALIAIQILCVVLGGNGLLGLMPFLVVYAVFNFSWRTAVLVTVLSLVTVILLPALSGQLDDLWFFSVLILSAGAGSAFARMGEETMVDRAALQTHLAVSDERNRVARDVHDVLGHSLTAVILKTQVCTRLVDTVSVGTERDKVALDKVRAELSELDSVARQALSEVRSTVGGLRIAALSDEVAAARSVLADASVKLTVRGSADTLSPEQEAMLAWVVRESVTNIVRHARSANCVMEIGPSIDDSASLIRITDDGVGLGLDASTANSDGNGIRGMRERIEAAGAELLVGPGSDATGTRVEVRS